MTRAELHNLLRQYADAQAVADNADGDADWAQLSDAAGALAIAILNEFGAMSEKESRYDEVTGRVDHARQIRMIGDGCPLCLGANSHDDWCPLRPMTWEQEQ
jgi:hypothetical protein